MDDKWKPNYHDVNYQDLISQLDQCKHPSDIDRELVSIFKSYLSIVDTCYDSVLSKTSELSELLKLAPGLLVMRHNKMGLPDIADLLKVDVDLLSVIVERNRHFITFTEHGLSLNRRLFEYLCNKERSGRQYIDRRLHDITICMRGLSMFFEGPYSNDAS